MRSFRSLVLFLLIVLSFAFQMAAMSLVHADEPQSEASPEKAAEFAKLLRALMDTYSTDNGAERLRFPVSELLVFNTKLSELASKLTGATIPEHPDSPYAKHYMVIQELHKKGYFFDIGWEPHGDKHVDMLWLRTGVTGNAKSYNTAALITDLKALGLDLGAKAQDCDYYLPQKEEIIFPRKVDGDTIIPFGRVNPLPNGSCVVAINVPRLRLKEAAYKQLGAKFDLQAEIEQTLRNEFASVPIFEALVKKVKSDFGAMPAELVLTAQCPNGLPLTVKCSALELNEAFSDLCTLGVRGPEFFEVNRIFNVGHFAQYRVSHNLLIAALQNASKPLSERLRSGDNPIVQRDDTINTLSLAKLMATDAKFCEACIADVRFVYVGVMKSFLKRYLGK